MKFKWLARRAICSAAFFSGYCYLTELLEADRGVRILCYHSICDRPKDIYTVSTQDFANQMALLADQYSVISLEQLVDLIRNELPISPRTVAITIDDGYRNSYTNAYPILRRFGFPATIFPIVEPTGASSSERVAGKFHQADLLTWNQVREMSDNGMSFGSHTSTHVSLTTLTRQETRRQLESSKAKLEMEIGKPVTGFAYPFGTFRSFSPEIEQLVADSGYLWAVTAISGVNHHKTNLFALRRTIVQKCDDIIMFGRVMKGALDPWILMQMLGRLYQE